jgi:hypothetical protein
VKSLSISLLLFFLSFFGAAHAENVYDMKYQGYLIKAQSAGPGSSTFFDPIPIAEISNDNLIFSGDASLIVDDPSTFNPSTCCSVNLGNQGGFTVIFDNPVNSVGLDIFPRNFSSIDVIEQLGNSTVSAVYKNSEGKVVGQSSVTANWLGELYGPQQWNNVFNGHQGAFGVSSIDSFSEITFSVDGMGAIFTGKGFSFAAPLSLGSTELYYSYANPVPEPETYAMLLSGLGLIGFMAKRRKKSGIKAD